ncbi:MAG: guanylate kinase [Deltaproteobacteria bacterium]|nr:guanylate kinase [Deltaproteobacteria bacterium]TSA07491.1 MAG: guanylate kinase [Deltaproteobacteria bacterium]
MPGKGSLFVISAPSGAGKTTVCHRVLESIPDLAYSISHTTRPPRYGEKDGVDYFFVSEDEFLRMRERGDFLEWALVHNNYYGTAKRQISDCLGSGKDILLDIDVQGARQVRDQLSEVILIFILPPSWEVLEERLGKRQSDDEEALKLRMANARNEVRAVREYDYIIINDDLDEAVRNFKAIVQAERCRRSRVIPSLNWFSIV